MLWTGAGGHCVCLAADFAVATLEQVGEATRFEQQGPLQSRMVAVAVVVHHYHLFQNHRGFHEYLPPSEI